MFRIVFLAALLASISFAEPTMISIGDRRMAVYCEGKVTTTPTVVLIPAGGRIAKDWSTVQPAVSQFTRVCSYDHSNFGASDKAPVKLQSVEEVVDDLHAWLRASNEKAPYILVGHSNSNIYARRFATRYPSEVAAFVFVDSSHEEQALRLHELDPEGPKPDDITARIGFFIKPGQRLEWRTDRPVIALTRGKPFERKARDGSDSKTNRMTEEQFVAWDRIWREFQQDLVKRSPRGELRIAETSGHSIQRDQPELVIQAIRDVSRHSPSN